MNRLPLILYHWCLASYTTKKKLIFKLKILKLFLVKISDFPSAKRALSAIRTYQMFLL